MSLIKKTVMRVSGLLDVLLLPLTILGGLWFKYLRHCIKTEAMNVRLSRRLFRLLGVFPIIDTYDEPLFNTVELKHLDRSRQLPGIDFNVEEQLAWLDRFDYNAELKAIPLENPDGKPLFHYHNGFFEAGDAEYLYSLIRTLKPRKMIEIGSGFSTLMTRRAIEKNRKENPDYDCLHVAIEPYSNPWLEKTGATIIRKKIEDVEKDTILDLRSGDVLFVDTSHIVRPQGDVLFLFLEIFPLLDSGVFVHVHDIFSPWDYPREWMIDRNRFYSEQYLLEAFLSCNGEFRIIGALNFLRRNYPSELFAKCPILDSEPETRPGSLWMMKTGTKRTRIHNK